MSRVYEDGYNDGKAGRQPLGRQLFEKEADYKTYVRGYNRGVDEGRPLPKHSTRPYPGVSG